MNVPSVSVVTLPPCVVGNVPATSVTPPAGRSLAMMVPVSGTNGVAGDAVAPPVTTAWVLLTKLLYVSPLAAGLTAIEKPAAPVQLLAVSVAVTVKLKVPVAVGVPLMVPSEARLSPGGNVPAVTANVYGPVPPEAVKLWPAYEVLKTAAGN